MVAKFLTQVLVPGARGFNLVGEGREQPIDIRVGIPKHLDPMQRMTDSRVVPSVIESPDSGGALSSQVLGEVHRD